MIPFSIFMPLKRRVHGFSDLDRFVNIGLVSIRRFLKPEWIREFVIVAPASDLPHIEMALRGEREIKFRLIDEADYLPRNLACSGWLLQQLLKLSAGDMTDAEWILILDSDVIFTREVKAADLFIEGRAVVHLVPARQHLEWYQGSMALLGAAALLKGDDLVMAVTPELLHAPTLRALCGRLRVLALMAGVADWRLFLLHRRQQKLRWTEYSLYWCFVVQQQLRDALYATEKTVICGESVWFRDAWHGSMNDMLRRAFDPDADHIAIVIQSNAKIRLSRIIAAVHPYLHQRPYGRMAFVLRSLRESMTMVALRVTRGRRGRRNRPDARRG